MIVGLCLSFLLPLAGCSMSAEDTVGSACTEDEDCSGALQGGYCPDAAMCTKHCDSHADCGCEPGTTNADISAGKCNASCVEVGSQGYCLRVCNSSSDCEGNTSCEKGTSNSYCL